MRPRTQDTFRLLLELWVLWLFAAGFLIHVSQGTGLAPWARIAAGIVGWTLLGATVSFTLFCLVTDDTGPRGSS